jgi:hypothetical protein
MEKRGFAFSFGWIFAIIVGAVIIFLAVYATTRFVSTERDIQESEAGKELGILLTPMGTGLESGKVVYVNLPGEYRLFNSCYTKGNFGSQDISVAIKSGIGEEWDEPGAPSSFHNKYLFSEGVVQGERYITFTKPFEFPYKIGDLTYLWSANQSFCFVGTPRDIEEEIEALGLTGNGTGKIEVVDSKGDCGEEDKVVCFNRDGCDVDVSIGIGSGFRGSVEKNFVVVDFESQGLMYGAIFADPGIYECQVQRLMKRASELALLYNEKSLFLTPKGCSSNLEGALISYAQATLNITESGDLSGISGQAKELGRRNEQLNCKLF